MTLIPLYSPNIDRSAVPAGLEIVTSQDTIRERFSSHLGDESKVKSPGVKEIAFPRSLLDVSWILQSRADRGLPTTVSASRTGIAAGAVPSEDSGVLSVERLKAIKDFEQLSSDEARIWVEAGVPLRTLNEFLAAEHPLWLFPVDPTETTAAIGGMTATNASGARTYHYGPMRKWVSALRVVLAGGECLEVRRGECILDGEGFKLLSGGEERTLQISEILKPETKNTIGYSFAPGIDLLDVLIGSEGTLCVFCDIQLRLCRKPLSQLCYLQFFNSDEAGLDFVKALRSSPHRPLAIEFFDVRSLQLLSSNLSISASPITQLISDSPACGVYVEYPLENEDQLFEFSETLGEIVESLKGDPERSFAGTEEKDLREFRLFRHALPEQVNAIIALRKQTFPGLHKLATDMAVPDEFLVEVFQFYRDELEALGLEFVIFGHAGNNHFHVNMLPRDEAELRVGKAVYQRFAEQVVQWQGAVASEHGIGRLKRSFLSIQYSPEEIENMKKIKFFFDPKSLLNPGVLFS